MRMRGNATGGSGGSGGDGGDGGMVKGAVSSLRRELAEPLESEPMWGINIAGNGSGGIEETAETAQAVTAR